MSFALQVEVGVSGGLLAEAGGVKEGVPEKIQGFDVLTGI